MSFTFSLPIKAVPPPSPQIAFLEKKPDYLCSSVRALIAQLVRASDQRSEDQGSNLKLCSSPNTFLL